jgi:thiol-disulfide isomerase/thioredoxin
MPPMWPLPARTAFAARRRLLRTLAGTLALPLLAPGRAHAAHEARPWPAGKPAPALALQDLDGKAWSLAGLKGRAVVINFWATWCEPCRAELPSLEALAARHGRDGLVVLTVNYQESVAAIERFLAIAPLSLPVLLDRDGQAARAWTPRIFPSTVLVGRTGRPSLLVVGEVEWAGAAAGEWVKPLLGRGRTT